MFLAVHSEWMLTCFLCRLLHLLHWSNFLVLELSLLRHHWRHSKGAVRAPQGGVLFVVATYRCPRSKLCLLSTGSVSLYLKSEEYGVVLLWSRTENAELASLGLSAGAPWHHPYNNFPAQIS